MVEVVAALGGADCERIGSGWLAQPANALSSLTYVAVGVRLLWRGRDSGLRRSVLLAGGAALVGVGVGSFAYHGPQPGWAHLIHNAAILGLAIVMVGDHVWLLSRRTLRRAVRCLVAAWRPAGGWIVLALVAFWVGRTDSGLCRPDAVWQPHAVWHALSAVGLGLVVAGCSAHFGRLAGLAGRDAVLGPEGAAEVGRVGEPPPQGGLGH
jgi:hypothetical protein